MMEGLSPLFRFDLYKGTCEALTMPILKNYPFDEKFSDFAVVRLFSAEKRMQYREIWKFIGNCAQYPYHSGVKLTELSLHTAPDCTGKGSKIAGFIVFGGGKLYDGTANRRKQSTKRNFLSGCQLRFLPIDFVAQSLYIFLCAKYGDL